MLSDFEKNDVLTNQAGVKSSPKGLPSKNSLFSKSYSTFEADSKKHGRSKVPSSGEIKGKHRHSSRQSDLPRSLSLQAKIPFDSDPLFQSKNELTEYLNSENNDYDKKDEGHQNLISTQDTRNLPRETKEHELTKDLLIDAVNLPFVLAGSVFYYINLMQIFTDNAKYDPNDKGNSLVNWKSIISFLMVLVLALVVFATCSETSTKLFKVKTISNHPWTRFKAKSRSLLGIPSAMIRSLAGSGALYLLTANLTGKVGAGIIAAFMGIFAFPSQLSLYWSDMVKKQKSGIAVTDEDTGSWPLISCTKRTRSYLLIHIPTFCYAFQHAALYFLASLNIPKAFRITNSMITPGENVEMDCTYFITMALMLLPLMSSYVSYSHLIENMSDLTAEESLEYHKLKIGIKKLTGIPAGIIKALTFGASSYAFFKSYMPDPANISLTILSCASSMVSQVAIFHDDPLKDKEETKSVNPSVQLK